MTENKQPIFPVNGTVSGMTGDEICMCVCTHTPNICSSGQITVLQQPPTSWIYIHTYTSGICRRSFLQWGRRVGGGNKERKKEKWKRDKRGWKRSRIRDYGRKRERAEGRQKRGIQTRDDRLAKAWIRGLQRDVVFLGWPIASSYMSPNAGGREGSCGVSDNEYMHRSPNKL